MKTIIYMVTILAYIEPIICAALKKATFSYGEFPFDSRNQLRRLMLRDTRRGVDLDGFKPGHTLLRPSEDWLWTSLGFPSATHAGANVYGATENIGSSGSNGSIINTLFRRSDADKHVKTLMRSLLSAVRRISDEAGLKMNSDKTDENGALRTRPDAKPVLRSEATADLVPDAFDSAATQPHGDPPENEKNPGNPFTIFGKKYYQNALWNYKLDGDHMNLHVAAPAGGPSPMEPDGAQLFFGRKWWYFNQDDYLPF